MRYLAIDYGAKRTGLAVGDDVTGQAGPVDVIVAGDEQAVVSGVVRALEEHEVDALVLGVPYNMDGTMGPAAGKSLHLAEVLGQRTGLVVHLADERLTTYEADDLMRGSGLTRKQKKARRDAIAAASILRGFLASRGTGPLAL